MDGHSTKSHGPTPLRDSREPLHRHPLIVGMGQELRGDDAIGRRVAERFATLHPDMADVLSVTQLTPELAESISSASEVVFVDAREGGIPGNLRMEWVALESRPSTGLSHLTAPEELLAYSSGLFGFAPDAVIVTISGSCFDYGTALSPTVELAGDRAVEAIRAWLESRSVHRADVSAIVPPCPESSALS